MVFCAFVCVAQAQNNAMNRAAAVGGLFEVMKTRILLREGYCGFGVNSSAFIRLMLGCKQVLSMGESSWGMSANDRDASSVQAPCPKNQPSFSKGGGQEFQCFVSCCGEGKVVLKTHT